MTENIKPQISYFKSVLASERTITRDLIKTAIASDKLMGPALDDHQKERILRHLEASIVIVQDLGAIVTDNQTYEPWLTTRKPDVCLLYTSDAADE